MAVQADQQVSVKRPLLLSVLAGQKVARPPLWCMRQAGRYLPEYRALREKYSMLDLIRNADLAAEVTIQPLRRFELDASIIFADILNPLIGMGLNLEFHEGKGPVITNPIQNEQSVKELRVPDVEENVGYTLEALKIVRKETESRGITLIGFAGAPFTLSVYALGSQGKKNFEKVKSFALEQPQAWHALQEKLSNMLIEYFCAQANAGAQVLQLFDSWLGVLGPAEYSAWVEPYLLQIITAVKERTGLPVIFFATGIQGLYPQLRKLPVSAFGVDWRLDLKTAEAQLQTDLPLQGNLDPAVLAFAPKDYLRDTVRDILKAGRELKGGHIFNLGHGIIPETPPERLNWLCEWVRDA